MHHEFNKSTSNEQKPRHRSFFGDSILMVLYKKSGLVAPRHDWVFTSPGQSWLNLCVLDIPRSSSIATMIIIWRK